MNARDSNDLPSDGGERASASRRWSSRRLFAHSLGLLIAALIVWLVLRGYRQPELLLDFANARMC